MCLTGTMERLDGKEVIIKQYAPICDTITMDEAIENMAESLSDEEIKKIIDAAQEEMLNNKVARLVEENFMKIRQDVENIIKDEMGDDDESDEDTESDSPFDDYSS